MCSIRGKHYIWRRGFKQKQNAENRPSDADIIGATFIHCIDLLQDNHRLEFLLRQGNKQHNTSESTAHKVKAKSRSEILTL